MRRTNEDSLRGAGVRRLQLNRRAFLRGSAALAIGLPFLESVQHRSAWAVGDEPRFAFFIGTSNGVVQDRFWPTEPDVLTDLSTDLNAAGALAGLEQWLSFVQGFNYTATSTGDTHAQSYCQTFTGAPHDGGSGATAMATAPSIDTILAPYLNPDGREPLTLYSGMKQGYIDERLSFVAAGELRLAEGNPFQVYSDLLQAGTGMGTDGTMDAQLADMLARRSSAIDFVRDDLETLLTHSGLGAADRQRLELHLNSLRELELDLSDSPMGTDACSEETLDVDAIVASAENYDHNGVVEQVAELQMQLCAFAFACNIHHVATLQSGDGQDNNVYDVPSNERGWRFHHVSHRVQSDSGSGTDALAEAAHAEIDRMRLETFRRGLEKFEQHGLLERSVIMWANQFADGPSGSFNNLPIILAGNAGGALRTGLHLSSGGSGVLRPNGMLLTTIAHALGVNETIGVSEGTVDELLV
jgi:hypothetical protein